MEITKRLRKNDWDRLTELLGTGDVGFVRFTSSTDDSKGGDHYGQGRESKYRSSSVEVAMKEAPPAVEGSKRVRLAFKEAPVLAGDHYFGFALVSMTKSAEGEWETHVDHDGDSMTDAVLVKAWKETFGTPTPFFEGHDADDRTIKGWVSWFPATRDVMKGLGFEGDKSGLVAAMKVDDADLRAKIDSGKLPDISIEALVKGG